MSRPFKTLRPQEVLALAINVEIRNAARFASFARLFDDYEDDVSELFGEMEREELEHRRRLEILYKARYGDDPFAVSEEDVDEVVEAVNVDDAEHMIFNSITREKVLEDALRAENGARSFYEGVLASTKDAELRALYQELGSFEEEHVRALESARDAAAANKAAAASPRPEAVIGAGSVNGGKRDGTRSSKR